MNRFFRLLIAPVVAVIFFVGFVLANLPSYETKKDEAITE